MRIAARCLAAAALVASVAADPTWPWDIYDEMEEIMYQLFQFEARNFADTISPCTNEASGPGRQNAAEWLRVGFHDMSTADVATGSGGLDASIQYELDSGENLGPAFNTTLEFMSNFLTTRSSISDLLALGVYASVRSCGGPVVPFRAGRIDATVPGRTGVPQPEHPVETFREQFRRMGFTPEEMIQVTACGHTLGGVHGTEFPDLLIQGEAPLDASVAKFDNNVVTEYLENNTTNPLVVGPAVAIGKDSDSRIFASDGNVTAKALANPLTFRDVCSKVLQKMIETVPRRVMLTEPVLPYMVKPVHMQLTLNNGGRTMRLTGDIRVRTTDLPKEELGKLTLMYKDRNGGNDCGSCSTTSNFLGVSYGFDDSFAFFPLDATISAATGVSSFNISIALKNGTALFFDNNGNDYPLQDAVMILRPNSCLTQHTGDITAVAAVRNDRLHLSTELDVSYKVPRPGVAVPGLYTAFTKMTKGECVGHYTLYSASWKIPGGISHSARIDILSGIIEMPGTIVDDFNHAVELPGTCQPFHGPPASQCRNVTVASVAQPSPTSTSAAITATSSPTPVSSLMLTTPVAGTEPATTPTTSYTHPHAHPSTPDLDSLTQDKGFFGSLISYVANYLFGYDRYQIVNNQIDR